MNILLNEKQAVHEQGDLKPKICVLGVMTLQDGL